MPQASNRSALPHWLEIDRLPCLATRTPAPATTKAATVEMLNVLPPVAPRAAGIEQGLACKTGVDGDGHPPHGARETDQFVDGFALHFEGDQEGGDLRMAGLAAQNNLHGGFRVGGRQALFGDQAIQVRQKRHDILGFL